MSKIYDFLKGKFLISDDAIHNWRFILFCTVLAIFMIACSHDAERKVHQIARLNKEVKDLRSESIEAKKNVMKLKMKSSIEEKVLPLGMITANEPAKKLKVSVEK